VSVHRRRTRVRRPLAALGIAAVLTVTLAQVPVQAAFRATSGSTGNSVGSAASFCTAAPTTLYSAGDAWVDRNAATTNTQNDVELRVLASPSLTRRIWIRFDLPASPGPHCSVAQARLRFYNKTPTANRDVVVRRGTASATPWTADMITWNNQPVPTGTAVGSETAKTTWTPGWQYWNVTTLVNEQDAGGTTGNNGLVLLDGAESSGSGQQQVYFDRQDATYHPTLVLTWGLSEPMRGDVSAAASGSR